MTLRHGDTGRNVTALQRELVRAGQDIEVDGWYGDATEAAVRAVQREHGLAVDGLAGPRTRQALQRGADPRALRQIDLVNAAERLDVDLAAVQAINEVESRGHGFYIGGPADGQPVILFERHIMRRRLIHHGIDPTPHQRRRPDIVNDSPGGYLGGIHELERLAAGKVIHHVSGLESASWGRFQIMGFHWQHLGYASAQAFAEAMQRDEAAQLEAFCRFIERDTGLHRALRRNDWREVARRYNGPAFERNDYDTQLAAAYRRYGRQLETAA